jgi:hypothetical protein
MLALCRRHQSMNKTRTFPVLPTASKGAPANRRAVAGFASNFAWMAQAYSSRGNKASSDEVNAGRGE